jgi:hypothetical protein
MFGNLVDRDVKIKWELSIWKISITYGSAGSWVWIQYGVGLCISCTLLVSIANRLWFSTRKAPAGRCLRKIWGFVVVGLGLPFIFDFRRASCWEYKAAPQATKFFFISPTQFESQCALSSINLAATVLFPPLKREPNLERNPVTVKIEVLERNFILK